ncbi:MAG: zf-HC2 domain-containing protein [Burkholderiales bacterium]
MNPMIPKCGDVSSRLHGYADHALPAAERRLIEAHLEGCPTCRAELAQIEAVETRLRHLWRVQSAPAPELWERIRMRLAPPASVRRPLIPWPGRGWQRAAAAFAVVAAVAGTTVVGYHLVETRHAESRFVAAPIEELKAFVDSRRPMDVATTDLGELHGWFRGKIDFSIPEPRTRGDVRLVGGRLCFFLERRIASMMYEAAGGRVVSLYVIPAHLETLDSDSRHVVAGEPVSLKRLGGYTQVMWQRDKLVYALVGDMPAAQLMELTSEFLHSTREPA